METVVETMVLSGVLLLIWITGFFIMKQLDRFFEKYREEEHR